MNTNIQLIYWFMAFSPVVAALTFAIYLILKLEKHKQELRAKGEAIPDTSIF